MGKTIKSADLAKMQSLGAKVEHESQRMQLDGMDAVLAEMRKIAKANEAIAQKRNDDLIAAITRLAAALEMPAAEPQDTGPAMAAILQSVTAQSERPSYQFNIRRNDLNLIESITATPDTRKAH